MADVYEMMMHLGLRGGALSALTHIGYKLNELHKVSGMINTNFSGWEGALKGVVGIFAGGVILGGMVKMLETAKEFSKEMTALQGLGGDMEKLVISGEMNKKVFDVAKITGQTVEDVGKLAGFANSILDTNNTMKALAELSKFSVIQTDSVTDHGKAIQNVIRAGMITGRITDLKTGDIDMEKLHNFFDEFQRLKSGTHGTFNEDVVLAMAKQGGGFLRGLTPEGMEAMAVITQSLGGPRTGTAFLGVYEQLARGQMTKKTAEGMEEVGLLKQGQWHMEKNVVKLEPEVSKALTAKFGANPLDLAKEIRENLIAKGITDPQEQMRLTANAFGRQTTRRFMAEFEADYNQMVGESKRLGQGYGVDKTFDAKMQKDMAFNLQQVQNAWHNLMVAIADPQTQGFITILHTITGIIHSLQDSIRGVDPNTLVFISKGLTALGAALVVGGMAAVIAAIGPTGWLIGAFTALAAINWEKIKGLFGVIESITGWMRTIDEWSAKKSGPLVPWAADKLNQLVNPWYNPATPVPVIPVPKPPVIPSVPTPNKFYEPDPKKFMEFLPTNFNPGEKKQVLQPITLSINMDGRTLAQAVTEAMEDLYNHPTGAAAANHWSNYPSVSANTTDT